MTFEAIETSIDDGRPVELYAFSFANGVFFFNSGTKRKMTVDGRVWEPAPIANDGVKQTGESTTDAMTITVPTNIAIAQLFMTSAPTDPVMVSIFQMHEGDDYPIATYVGEIAQVNFPRPGQCVFTCETISASLRREGLRLAWQRACTHVLFDPATCGVNKASYEVVGIIVTAINGSQLTVTQAGLVDDDYFSGGFAEWVHPVKGIERSTVEKHTGFVLTMFGPTHDFYVGMEISLYPGCDLTPETCQSKFSNYANYGGVPALPGKSPFDGDPIF